MAKRKQSNDTLKVFAVGAALAATAGLVVGILSRPKKPQTTQEKIKKAGEDTIADIEQQLKGTHKDLLKAIATAKATAQDAASKKELKEILTTAKDSKDKATEILHAFRDGNVDDKDLQKAIKDAKRSIKHLKDFVKK